MMTTTSVLIPGLQCSRHACLRARERFSWSQQVLQKLATRAMLHGLPLVQCRGYLRRYLEALYLQYGKANNLRVYGQVVYLFADQTLITLWPLPQELKALANNLSHRPADRLQAAPAALFS